MTEIDSADVSCGWRAGQQAGQHSCPEYSAAAQCTAIAPRARRRGFGDVAGGGGPAGGVSDGHAEQVAQGTEPAAQQQDDGRPAGARLGTTDFADVASLAQLLPQWSPPRSSGTTGPTSTGRA
jgi:hypothetical protein